MKECNVTSVPVLRSKEQSGRYPVITSGNFVNYLAEPQYWYDTNLRFSANLQLEVFTPFIKELAEAKSEVYINPEIAKEYRERKFLPESDDPQLSGLAELQRRILEDIYQDAEIKGEAERSRIVYLDLQDWQVKATGIEYGEHSSVTLRLSALPESDALNVMHMHTHPHDFLPSVQDTSLMISGFAVDEYRVQRYVKAELIICPSMQILAVATPRTPLFPPEEAKEVINNWQTAYQEQVSPRSDALQALRCLAITRKINPQFETYAEITAYQRYVAEKIANNEVTEGEGRRLIYNFETEHYALLKALVEEAIQIEQLVIQESDRYSDQTLNSLQMEYARAMHILLYASTNMQDFHLFSD
jgi:hypothetical protein